MPPSSQLSSSSRSRKSIREKKRGERRKEEKGRGKGEGDAGCCGRVVVVTMSELEVLVMPKKNGDSARTEPD